MSKREKESGGKAKRYVEKVIAGGGKTGVLYREFGISRATGYRWWRSFSRRGEEGLERKKRGPKGGGKCWARWLGAVVKLRKKWPHFGPRKLREHLRRSHPLEKVPSVRTVARMLSASGCSGGGDRKRRKAGPRMERAKLTRAERNNEVWTIDFKGHFETGDGERCMPLTVRDMFSSYLLAVEHVPEASDVEVRKVLKRCFRRHGVPGVMRVDNGPPFGGEGARGLTSLSAWWVRMGIRVEFTRPGSPQDNGGHEQMHRVLKKETAMPPAADLKAQKRRFREFCREYNEERPHEKLKMQMPAEVYRSEPGRLPKPRELRYPGAWECKRVSKAGLIYWKGKMRVIGRAFRNQKIGLKPMTDAKTEQGAVVEVYFGELLLGELHSRDEAALRSVQYHARRKRRK